MRPGDVTPTKSLRVVIDDGRGWVDFKAPKGRQFVLLLLGDEETKEGGQKLDPLAAIDALGWQQKKQRKPRAAP